MTRYPTEQLLAACKWALGELSDEQIAKQFQTSVSNAKCWAATRVRAAVKHQVASLNVHVHSLPLFSDQRSEIRGESDVHVHREQKPTLVSRANEVMGTFRRVWESVYGCAWVPEPGAHRLLTATLKHWPEELPWLEGAIEKYLVDRGHKGFLAQRRHPIRHFLEDVNKYRVDTRDRGYGDLVYPRLD